MELIFSDNRSFFSFLQLDIIATAMNAKQNVLISFSKLNDFVFIMNKCFGFKGLPAPSQNIMYKEPEFYLKKITYLTITNLCIYKTAAYIEHFCVEEIHQWRT
jgi:hypothetical protein